MGPFRIIKQRQLFARAVNDLKWSLTLFSRIRQNLKFEILKISQKVWDRWQPSFSPRISVDAEDLHECWFLLLDSRRVSSQFRRINDFSACSIILAFSHSDVALMPYLRAFVLLCARRLCSTSGCVLFAHKAASEGGICSGCRKTEQTNGRRKREKTWERQRERSNILRKPLAATRDDGTHGPASELENSKNEEQRKLKKSTITIYQISFYFIWDCWWYLATGTAQPVGSPMSYLVSDVWLHALWLQSEICCLQLAAMSRNV